MDMVKAFNPYPQRLQTNASGREVNFVMAFVVIYIGEVKKIKRRPVIAVIKS
jgi:hypothetical protein